ncbi:hypothetical protein [Paracoccus alkanivorans]|uniref:Uncharacterized protein n=1 Tax=Paracoccus alkanivorans TaxID=2116655 RepID=A0A3M0M0J9_9RHOB|nr:hypothetical protein [Paracoccus alkanivorans]RMC31166.1 hypothetical protein C9E81_20710 [Paracoccus alkanivorans]
MIAIDVGINPVLDDSGSPSLIGDVACDEMDQFAVFTQVPGGDNDHSLKSFGITLDGTSRGKFDAAVRKVAAWRTAPGTAPLAEAMESRVEVNEVLPEAESTMPRSTASRAISTAG